MQNDLLYLSIVALLIVIAPPLSRLSKIPVAVIEIMLGSLAAFLGVIQRSESFESISHISFLFLMLLAGAEVNLRSFRSLGAKFYKKAVIYFVCLYGFSIAIVVGFGLPAIYVAIFPVMSLGMIVTLLRDYGKEQDWLNTAFKIGVLGELVSITALVVVQNGYSRHLDSIYSFSFYEPFILLGLFILGCVIVFRISRLIFWWHPRFKLWFMPESGNANQDIRFSFMLFFVLIGITTFMDIEEVLGAFIAGVVIATFFAYKHDMISKLNDIGFGFFIPLFFIYVGSTLDLGLILSDFDIVLNGIYIVFAMLFVRLVSANISFLRYFGTFKNTLLFALSDCMPLTFLVAIASLGLKLGAISNEQYYSLIIAAIFEGIFFTIVIKILYYMWDGKNSK
ncbi:cation:proton antiporter [Helicobacter saguini]|uniref:Cation:proton antiporter n=1 Tax=Helicobacter saguini TaxID=1548018 RepID=A0A347VQG9_9HELI|nr:cation:proton antiporter [Helicobacter saguini]MWV60947.1 cation:proton antiporter [Helicobacter saguini]MWV68385.1 cation:proton antiporter [Helicobacter saguini]MWV70151.1 cation:proton antiporter [Helicobacter saguini]MWV72054.1 cation:proton antiporter [Helicobacter saguini]TLD93722.1 cation:proton antiporter [Helicobacter saguini]